MRRAQILASCALSTLLLASAAQISQSDVRKRVLALHLDSLVGRVPTYYSPGAHERAASLQRAIDEEITFFISSLHMQPNLTLAVLSEADWAKIRATPYGEPWVSDAPHVVLLPADLQASVIVKGFASSGGRASGSTRAALEAAGVRFETAPYRLNDLIGYHEIGHVIVGDCGLEQTQRWFNEMLATYVAYAFMRERRPEDARAFDALMRLNAETLHPSFRSLNDFETHFQDIPGDNYGWYQAMFYSRVVAVYDREHLGFLDKLRRGGIVAGVQYQSPAHLLKRLEQISPGFERWANLMRQDAN